MSEAAPNYFDQIDPPKGAAAPVAVAPPAAPNVFDVIDPKPPQQVKKAEDDSSILGQVNRAAGLTQRALITGATAVPGMIMDAGVAGRNLVGDAFHKAIGAPATPDYDLPYSGDFQKWLTEQGGMPEPQGFEEKAASTLWAAGAGGGLDKVLPMGGGPAVTAPAGFVPPGVSRAQAIAATLQRLQGKGFKVPPATTNPTLGNRVLEGVAGKENVQNFARIDNDTARTAVAAKTLNLNPDAFTPGAVAAVKKEAGQAWEVGRAVPSFKTDDQYLNDLIAVQKEGAGANESFPGASNPDVAKVVDTYTQPSMTGNSAVSAVKLLRDKASDAFRTGNSELGRTYKGVAQAIEAQFDRAVQNPALGVKPTLVKDIQSARQLYAKASLIEDSMLPDGTVSGQKLAAAWRNDEPITGDLRDAAEFAAQYPKANVGASASGSPVNHIASGFGPLLAGGFAEKAAEHIGSGNHGLLPLVVGGLGYPAARYGARSALLSRWGQGRAIPDAAASALTPKLSPAALASGLAGWDQGGQ